MGLCSRAKLSCFPNPFSAEKRLSVHLEPGGPRGHAYGIAAGTAAQASLQMRVSSSEQASLLAKHKRGISRAGPGPRRVLRGHDGTPRCHSSKQPPGRTEQLHGATLRHRSFYQIAAQKCGQLHEAHSNLNRPGEATTARCGLSSKRCNNAFYRARSPCSKTAQI